jgi:outer membrane lipoprotein SlyB
MAENNKRNRNKTNTDSVDAGEAVGTVSGGVAGAAAGSLLGPVGTVVGGIAGAALGNKMGEGAEDTDNDAKNER